MLRGLASPRDCPRARQLGRAFLPPAHSLERARSGRPFRRVRAASAFHEGTARLFPLSALTRHGWRMFRDACNASRGRRLSMSIYPALAPSRKERSAAMNCKLSPSAGVTRMVVTAIVVAISAAGAVPAAGDAAKDLRDAQQLVERARLTVESFAADGTVGPSVRNLIQK